MHPPYYVVEFRTDEGVNSLFWSQYGNRVRTREAAERLHDEAIETLECGTVRIRYVPR